MEIKEFIASLEKAHFSLVLQKGQLLLNGNKKILTKEEIVAIKKNTTVINYIKNRKDEIIAFLSATETTTSVEANTQKIASMYRLSGLQEGMLFHGLYDIEGGDYIEQFACDVTGIAVEVFMNSWKYLLKKYTVLRTGFNYDKFSIPVQYVYKQAFVQNHGGYGATVALALFIVIVVFSVLQYQVLRARGQR